jgi:prepilin-type N-terminal cleavage/methylation domain-containing protein
MTTLAPTSRRGITLLEVLIAIGILAIGLSSVVAILPAAKSQATRAVVLDRASGLAANLLADAATFGLLREGALSQTPDPVLNQIAIIDPAVTASYVSTAIPAAVQPNLRRAGIFSESATANAPADYHRLFTEGRDDVLLGDPPTPDDLPTHFFVDGARAYQGRMTALLGVRPPAPLATPPRRGVVSAVVFHNRDIDETQPVAVGSLNGVSLTLSTMPAGRTFRDLVKPGVVVYADERFHQLKSASIQDSTDPTVPTTAYVSTSTGATFSAGTPMALFPDSVGLAERPYTPEVNGAFLR